MTLAFFNLGYSYHAFGTCSKIIHSQLMGNSKYVIESYDTFEKVMNVLLPIGACISAPIMGTLATSGRRQSMMIVSGVFAFACLLTTIFNFFTIFIGRMLMGLCFGAYLTLVPLMVCELSPGSISGPLGVIGQIQGMTGFLISAVLQFAQPYSHDSLAMQSLVWKIVLGIPAAVSILQILLLNYVYDFDTPKFYCIHGDNKGYQIAMDRLYVSGVKPKRKSEAQLLSHGSLEDSVFPFVKKHDHSWREVFTFPVNRAMMVGCLFAIFHQAAGISSVSFVNEHLFTRDVDDYDAEYYSRTSVLLSGIAGFLAAITGFIASFCFGRRVIILVGELVMCVLLAILSNSSLLQIDIMGEVCDVIYVFAFNASLGSMLWLYVSETNGPKAISLAAFCSSAFVLVFMLFTVYIYHYFTEVGIYFNLFCCQTLCIAFMYTLVRETRGCLDKDRLYFPDELKKKQDEGKELDEMH